MAFLPEKRGLIDTNNSTTTPLSAGVTWSGTATDVQNFPSIVVATITDQDGTLQVQFSPDGTNWDSTLSFSVSASVNEVHRITVTRRYYRIRYINGSLDQTYIRLQSMLGSQQTLTSPLNGTVQDDADSIISRSILMGKTDGGMFRYVPTTQEGHLEVAIHDPLLPFGSIHTESLTPIFQYDALYGFKHGETTTTTRSGTYSNENGMYTVSTGTTSLAQSVIQGRKRLRYRAGQGIVGRFTTLFTTPTPYSYQLVGLGHAESGIYVGYGNTNDLSDTSFGILHVTGGVREIKTLTITTGANVSGNVIINLNGTTFSVPVTNSSNINRTSYEISMGTFSGWKCYPEDGTVVFLRDSAGVTSGTHSFNPASTGSVGTITQTKAGVNSTDTFYPQSSWNGDKLDGFGASGVTLDKTMLNIWQINIGYLGTDVTTIKCKVYPEDSNNATWVICNTIAFPNSRLTPNYSNPSFPYTIAVYSAGSTASLTVKSASCAGFIEGRKVLHGNRFTYFNQLTNVGATNLHALFTILNARVYGSISNQSVINILNISGAIKHSSPVIFYLIKGGTLAGNPNFTQLSQNSCSLYDTAATTVTYSDGDQILATYHVGDTGQFDHSIGTSDFNAEEITIQPGEWVTLAAKSTIQTPQYVTGSINTREDQ